jgi:hypothetical protein
MKTVKGWAFITTTALVALGSLVACGGDSVSCGKGTQQDGDTCVAKAALGDGGTSSNVAPTFAGITSVAPSSDVSLQVTWDAASDDATPAEELRYRVYVATSEGAQNFGAPTVEPPAGVRSIVVPALEPGKEYFIVVRAVDAGGLEDTNTTEESGTPTTDTAPPTFSGAKSVTTMGATSVELSWDAATDDLTPPAGISYTILWGVDEASARVGKVGKLTEPGVTSAVVDVLPDAETKFYFVVRARDAAGNTEENDTVVSGSTGPDVDPPVFSGCTAVGQPGATTTEVQWEPAKDDTTRPDDVTYNVYAFTNPPDEETPFGLPQTSFTGGTAGQVIGLSAQTRYYFVCRAADKSDNEDENLVLRTVLTTADDTPPVFGGLVTIVPGSTSAELSWTAATDDQTDQNEIVYLIYEATTSGGQDFLNPVAESSPGVTLHRVTGLMSNADYFWVVRARDKANNIDQNTSQLSAKTLVSFAQNIQPILTVHCVKDGCHSANNPPQGLNMSDGFAYVNLVDVQAIEVPTLLRVNPMNPDQSYMYWKLTAAPGIVQNPMPPPGQQQPTPEMIETIRLWIEQGAGNN